MRASSSWSRSLVALAVAAVGVVATGGPSDTTGDAEAAVVCQHPRKPLVRLRAGTCRKSEMTVFDTGTFGFVCAEDPARRLLTATASVGGLISLGYVTGPLCRTLDDDLTGCAHAFEVGMSAKDAFGYGATACAVVGGKCLPCYPPLEVEGLCRNACQPPIGCPADPTRTDGREACESATTPAACARSWTTSLEYAIPTDVVRATSCFWDAGGAACRACRPGAPGGCANTCVSAADLPRCRIGGRSYGRCSAHDGNAAACGLVYQLSPSVGTQTCWYDAGSADCRGCEPLDESVGRCTNGC